LNNLTALMLLREVQMDQSAATEGAWPCGDKDTDNEDNEDLQLHIDELDCFRLGYV